MAELEPTGYEVIEPSINPLGNKRSDRDLDAELRGLRDQQTDLGQVGRRPRPRRYSSGMPLVDIIGVEACEELAEELNLGTPPLHQRNLARRRKILEILTPEKP